MGWPDHIRIAMLALAIRNQTGNQGSALAWDRAMRLAADAPTALNMLAQMASNWGWLPEAEQVLWHAASRFPKQPWPLTSLQNLYIARRDTAGLRRGIRPRCNGTRRTNWPEQLRDAVVALRQGPSRRPQVCRGTLAGEPGNPVFASTYAFSLHLQGKTKEGIEVLRALKPEHLANPAVAVYYGILLSAAGEVQASKDYLDKSAKRFCCPKNWPWSPRPGRRINPALPLPLSSKSGWPAPEAPETLPPPLRRSPCPKLQHGSQLSPGATASEQKGRLLTSRP